MNDSQASVFTAFVGSTLLASGPLEQVALAAKKALDRGTSQPVLIYNDSTGRSIDIDSRGSDSEVLARLSQPTPPSLPRGRARSHSVPPPLAMAELPTRGRVGGDPQIS